MKIEIDQSGKIEMTNKPTILAFSNKINDMAIILSREKKILLKFFRNLAKPRLFVHLSFAAAIYLLIKKYANRCSQIILDREYPGYEKFISQKLREMILQNSQNRDFRIYTIQISQKSKAHILAYSIHKKKDKRMIRRLTAKEIIRIIKRNLKSGSV